tara:strand:+ start:1570 stop:2442 length:873 start_codon:yes stop_codon:yes gene_type:complete
LKINKRYLKKLIIEYIEEELTGAEMYSDLFNKPLDPDYRKDLRKLAKSKDSKPEEKPEEPKKVSKLKDLSGGDIQAVLNALGCTPEVLSQKVKEIANIMRKNPRVTQASFTILNLVSKELMAYFDELPKLGRSSISEGYVISPKNHVSIKEVITNWIEGEQPAPGDQYDMMATLDDILEYRDMSTKPIQLSIEEMETLKKDLRQTGLTDSIIIEVGKNGQAAITSGNQMIELAKHLNIQEIPVSFVFKDFVQKASKVTAEPATIRKAVEDQGETAVYGQSMQGRGSSLDV